MYDNLLYFLVEQNLTQQSASISASTPPPQSFSPIVDASSSSNIVLQNTPTTTAAVEEPLVWIPEPPSVPVEELTTLALSSNGEPTFASLGLGGWTPAGVVQQCLEYVHVSWGLPWWGSIMLGKQ